MFTWFLSSPRQWERKCPYHPLLFPCVLGRASYRPLIVIKDSEAYCLPLLLLPISASVNLEKAQMELSPHTLPIPKLFTITEKSYSKSNQFRKKEGGGVGKMYMCFPILLRTSKPFAALRQGCKSSKAEHEIHLEHSFPSFWDKISKDSCLLHTGLSSSWMMSLCCSLLSSVREGKVDPTLSGALSRDDSVSPFRLLSFFRRWGLLLAPWPGIEPVPLSMEVLTTGPPGNSLPSVFSHLDFQSFTGEFHEWAVGIGWVSLPCTHSFYSESTDMLDTVHIS